MTRRAVQFKCNCPERRKRLRRRAWAVVEYKSNHSAFNGYRRAPSPYSMIRCRVCGAVWRTKAGYVERLSVKGPFSFVKG